MRRPLRPPRAQAPRPATNPPPPPSPAAIHAATELAPPAKRRGPRPLALHLALAATRSLAASWPPGTPNWSEGSPLSKAGRREANRIASAVARENQPPEAFATAVLRHLAAQDAAMLAGIAAYRRQPPPPPRHHPPPSWREGGSRLLPFGGVGTPILFVPSLVNHATVLDLLPEWPDGSMLRWLAGQGLRPWLLDWGAPGPTEAAFTLTDYVAGRLERAIEAAVAQAGEPIVLAGYCMGGLLALAAAQRRPDRVRGLALLATPWDFWAAGAAQPRAVGGLLPALEPLLHVTGGLPVDALQALFAMVEPFGVAAKYRAFVALDATSERARRFVALEDWLNDGVPLVAAVARETLGGWYGANTPARGEWRIAGLPVAPALPTLPCFMAIPTRDRLVPPETALALAAHRPGAVVHRAAAGHVGMVAGAQAATVLWQPLADWARSLG